MFTCCWSCGHIFIVHYPDAVNPQLVFACPSTVSTKQGDTNAADFLSIHLYLIFGEFPRICADEIIEGNLDEWSEDARNREIRAMTYENILPCIVMPLEVQTVLP